MAKVKQRARRRDAAAGERPARSWRTTLVPTIGTGLTAAAAIAGLSGRIVAARREASARRSRAALLLPAAGAAMAALAAIAAWRGRETPTEPA